MRMGFTEISFFQSFQNLIRLFYNAIFCTGNRPRHIEHNFKYSGESRLLTTCQNFKLR